MEAKKSQSEGRGLPCEAAMQGVSGLFDQGGNGCTGAGA